MVMLPLLCSLGFCSYFHFCFRTDAIAGGRGRGRGRGGGRGGLLGESFKFIGPYSFVADGAQLIISYFWISQMPFLELEVAEEDAVGVAGADSSTPSLVPGVADAEEVATAEVAEASWLQSLLEAVVVAAVAVTVGEEVSWLPLLLGAAASRVRAKHPCCCAIYLCLIE